MATSYLDKTYNSPNPLRRWAHRSRLRTAVRVTAPFEGARILDYGCGDGLFLTKLRELTPLPVAMLGFEPYMEPLEDAPVTIHTDWEDVAGEARLRGPFDIVTCFEVLEHFNPKRQAEALSKMASVVESAGRIVLSVPIEAGLPALVKNGLRRLSFPDQKRTYNLRNTMRSVLGRPLPEFRSSDDYLNHMGFYFRDLERVFPEEGLVIRRRFCSPLRGLGYQCNSQVFYELGKG